MTISPSYHNHTITMSIQQCVSSQYVLLQLLLNLSPSLCKLLCLSPALSNWLSWWDLVVSRLPLSHLLHLSHSSYLSHLILLPPLLPN